MLVRVRPAAEPEFAAAGVICVDAYRADGQLAPPPGSEENAEYDYALTLADVAGRATHSDVLIAVDADTDDVVGCVTYVTKSSPLAELAGDGEAEFRMLAVAPSAQGNGVGAALVRACIDRAAEQGSKAIVICVRNGNDVAMKLYARFGFIRTPDRDFVPVPHVFLQALRLDLN